MFTEYAYVLQKNYILFIKSLHVHNTVYDIVVFSLCLTSLFFDLQLEVLGRSLFWDNICKRIEYDPHIDPSPTSVIQNISLTTSSSNQQPVPSSQTAPAASQSFDLLSGWDEPKVVQTGSTNTNPFLNDDDFDTATNPFLSWDPFAPSTSETTTHGSDGEWQFQKSQMTNPQTKAISATAAADYIEIVKRVFKSDSVCYFNYHLGIMLILYLFVDSSLPLYKLAISRTGICSTFISCR